MKSTSRKTTPSLGDDDEEELSEDEREDERVSAIAANAAAIAEPVKTYPPNIERQRQRILRRKVERALEEKAIGECCLADDLDFADHGELVELPDAPKGEDFYIYQDNGSNILAIAHLDSVEAKSRFFYVSDDAQHGDVICSPTLDDRLGAYVILHLLPKLGIKTDILLTVGEERGHSTAEHFKLPEGRHYNWMFQFDRTGADVVMYQYATDQRRALLRSVGAMPAYGAFSDISHMGHMGCAGFNWGVGYHDYHGPRAWASLHELILQVARFWRFYDRYSEVHMKHQGTAGRPQWSGSQWPNGYTSWGERLGQASRRLDDGGTAYDRWRKANGYSPLEKGKVGAVKNGTGFRPSSNATARTIPDIDEQLRRQKRGSRRSNRRARREARRSAGRGQVYVAGSYYDPGDAYLILEGRCPVCNNPLNDGGCGYCDWSVDSGMNPMQHYLNMTDKEYERYEQTVMGVEREEAFD